MRVFHSLPAVTVLSGVVLLGAACNRNNGERSTNANNANAGVNTTANRTNANTATTSPTVSATIMPSQSDIPLPEARRITVEELRAALRRNEAVVVDVRSEPQFQAGHIRGAISIPEYQITERASELPRDKLIVTYCS